MRLARGRALHRLGEWPEDVCPSVGWGLFALWRPSQLSGDSHRAALLAAHSCHSRARPKKKRDINTHEEGIPGVSALPRGYRGLRGVSRDLEGHCGIAHRRTIGRAHRENNDHTRLLTPRGPRIHICLYIWRYIYIYIHIERERERDGERARCI